MNRIFLAALLLAFSLPGFADDPAPIPAQPNAEDPVIEARLVRLAEDLRCLVCQNESLAGSHAALAEDLRREIRAQMKAGKDDREVIAYLTDRYGDFVLYKPPFNAATALLWVAPGLLVVGGLAGLVVLLRRRREATAAAPTPDPARRKEIEALLAAEDEPRRG